MRYFKYVSLEEAYRRIKRNIKLRLKKETVSVNESIKRVLAEKIFSPANLPEKTVSHFDGYAVRSIDTIDSSVRNPVKLKVKGKIFLDTRVKISINRMEAAYISTGAVLPEGSDSVIPVERVRKRNEEYIEVLKPVKKHENVTVLGSDFKAGEEMFGIGHVLRPQDIKLLKHVGVKRVKVYRRPLLSLIPVGSEFSDSLGLRRKKETSSLMVTKLVEENGGKVRVFKPVPDDPRMLRTVISKALSRGDIVATIGGASVGAKDYVLEALSSLPNSKILFRGIKIQPGRVTTVVLVESKPIVLLPGHVQSTWVGVTFVLIPLIRLFSGRKLEAAYSTLEAKLVERLVLREYLPFKRIRFVRVTDKDGEKLAYPILGDSSMHKPLVLSNGFVMVPEMVSELSRGQKVEVMLF